jgi:hypothetical protein
VLQGSSGPGAAVVAACDALAPVPLAAVLQVAGQPKACCGDMEEQGKHAKCLNTMSIGQVLCQLCVLRLIGMLSSFHTGMI